MSRSGYHDDTDDMWAMIRWRGAVASAIGGKRGQAALREILAALDAMPVKELAAESLVTSEGDYCTLGVLGQARGLDMSSIDPEDREAVAKAFGISGAMAAEIMFENDEAFDGHYWNGTTYVPYANVDAARWSYMRKWVADQIKPVDGVMGAEGGGE